MDIVKKSLIHCEKRKEILFTKADANANVL